MERQVFPSIFLISETQLHHLESSVYEYLELIGAGEYKANQCQSELEDILMIGGKLCYRSFKAGLNKNVTKVREDPQEYLTNINKVGHGSVVEHGNVGFIFHNVSRVFTHELVRHRTGIAFSQESLRYVRLTELQGYLPTCLQDDWGRQWHTEKLSLMSKWQEELAEHYKIDEMKDFNLKKEVTSAFRRYAPIGLATSILCTMNIRTLRHTIQMRTDEHAEEEIRYVFDKVAQLCKAQYPYVFNDFEIVDEIKGINVWECKHAAMPYDQKKINRLQKQLEESQKQIEKLQMRLDIITGDEHF